MLCAFLGALATKEEEPCDKHTTSKANKKVSALKNICELKRPEVYTMISSSYPFFFYLINIFLDIIIYYYY